MKKHLTKILGLILLQCTFQTCTVNEPEIQKKEQVTFSFAPVGGDTGGRANGMSLPVGTTVVLSIQTTAGISVFNNKSISLLAFGDSYITSPIELVPNDYKITDFMLVNTSGQVIYATPKIGSPLAQLVSTPLPFQFTVAKNKVTSPVIEVVNVKTKKPEDFGYASFGVKTVELLPLSVFIKNLNGLTLTSANAFILKNDKDTLSTYSLKPEVNLFPFKEDPSATYKLVVIKEGYARYAKTFTYSTLISSIEGNALKIILEPAFTFIAHSTGFDGAFEIYRIGADSPSKIFIDWGDGSPQESLELKKSSDAKHTYLNAPFGSRYYVSVTGEIDKITSCGFYYGLSGISQINLENLPALKSFDVGFNAPYGVKTYDFSNNSNLEELTLSYISKTENVILPVNNKINSIWMDEIPTFKAESLNDLIEKLYNSVKASNRRNGNLYLNNGDPANHNYVVPPSTESINKLRILKNQFGWKINPNPAFGG
jgi:hypothetical protein